MPSQATQSSLIVCVFSSPRVDHPTGLTGHPMSSSSACLSPLAAISSNCLNWHDPYEVTWFHFDGLFCGCLVYDCGCCAFFWFSFRTGSLPSSRGFGLLVFGGSFLLFCCFSDVLLLFVGWELSLFFQCPTRWECWFMLFVWYGHWYKQIQIDTNKYLGCCCSLFTALLSF